MSRIYVGRLSYQVREKDVERFFRGFGRVKDINLKNGFGFVVSANIRTAGRPGFCAVKYSFSFTLGFFSQEFDDPRDADDAVYECNGRELLGER